MLAYLARRLLAAAVLLLVVLSATFFLVHLAPGDPTQIVLDPRLPPASRDALRTVYGLDQPLLVQYGRWLRAAATGDWGISFAQGRPVARLLAEALPASLWLALAATLLELPLGLALGLLAARRHGRPADHVVRLLSLGLYAQPPFWLGLMLILLFARAWPLLPASHQRSLEPLTGLAEVTDLLRHLALPAATIALVGAGQIARFVRSGVLEAMGQDFARTARAKGLTEGSVLLRHALPAALGPLIQLLGLSFPLLLSGALAVEVVFAWPGVGRLAYTAVATRDYPVVLASTALAAVAVVLGSLLADLAQLAVDPRARMAART